jgi:hypothetical protein
MKMIELCLDYEIRFRTGCYQRGDPTRGEIVLRRKLKYDRPLAEGETIDTWFHDSLPQHYVITQIVHRISCGQRDQGAAARTEMPLVFTNPVGYKREKAEDLTEIALENT